MIKFTVNGVECTGIVRIHDTSVTGIRYKLIVTIPMRLPQRRRQSVMQRLYGIKPKGKSRPDKIGPWVLDLGNALYRDLGFRYGSNPNVEFSKGTTHFEYFFNDAVEAQRLGFNEGTMFRHVLKEEQRAAAEGYPAFLPPYRRVKV